MPGISALTPALNVPRCWILAMKESGANFGISAAETAPTYRMVAAATPQWIDVIIAPPAGVQFVRPLRRVGGGRDGSRERFRIHEHRYDPPGVHHDGGCIGLHQAAPNESRQCRNDLSDIDWIDQHALGTRGE